MQGGDTRNTTVKSVKKPQVITSGQEKIISQWDWGDLLMFFVVVFVVYFILFFLLLGKK